MSSAFELDGKRFTNHMPGEVAYFQPVIKKILWEFPSTEYAGGRYVTDDSAIPVLVVGAKIDGMKVLYDIRLPNGDGDYTHYPLCNVDSFFVHAASVADAEAYDRLTANLGKP